MNMFFSTLINDQELQLIGQEAQHCSKVLRKKLGEHINVMDGKGNAYECKISSIGRNEIKTDIIRQEYHEAPAYPSLSFGLIKNSTRTEWLLEKITEIGVSTITPLVTARSERKQLKVERLQKVIVSAAKQSLKYHIPALQSPIPYQDYIDSLRGKGGTLPLYIASYDAGHKDLWEYTLSKDPSVMLIGPEGDFTPQEVASAKSIGAIGVNLGASRLRAETAAMVACTHLNTRKQ